MTTQYDIELLQTIVQPTTEPVQLDVAFARRGVKAVTGLQKLVQRYTLALTTNLGSVPFDKGFGTQFWRDIYAGAGQNAGRLRAAFSFASVDAVRALRAEDRDVRYGDTPPDERIKSAILLDFDVDTRTGTVYLMVQLESEAGEGYQYKLPVEFLGGGT